MSFSTFSEWLFPADSPGPYASQTKADEAGNVFELESLKGIEYTGFRLTVTKPGKEKGVVWIIPPDHHKTLKPSMPLKEMLRKNSLWPDQLHLDRIIMAGDMITMLSFKSRMTPTGDGLFNHFWLFRGKLGVSQFPEYVRVSGYGGFSVLAESVRVPNKFEFIDPYVLEIERVERFENTPDKKEVLQLRWPAGRSALGLEIRYGRKGPFVLEPNVVRTRVDGLYDTWDLQVKIGEHRKAGTWFDKAPEYELWPEQIKEAIKKPE